jgi:hypothetical protein
MTNNPFDSDEFRLTPEQIAKLTPQQKKQVKRRSRSSVEFVRLPYEQTLAAAGQAKNALLAVLVELDHQRFVTHENPVSLASKALEAVGITRWTKCNALFELEVLGLVSVTWRGGKSPLVRLLWD